MTSQEAKQQVDACERKVVSAYDNMRSAARTVGTSAVSAAASKTTMSTLLPLIISVIGLLIFGSHPFWAIVLIVAGIWIAYSCHSSAKSIQNTVEGQQKTLNSTLDNNSKI